MKMKLHFDKFGNQMILKNSLIFLLVTILFSACKNESENNTYEDELAKIEEEEKLMEFGFNLNDYVVKRDTIKSGDTFGEILESHQIGYPKIYQIAEKTKDSFDIRRLKAGKPYTVLCAKDSLETAETFIYQPSQEDYIVINFKDSIYASTNTKPITYVEKTATGIIPQGSGISMLFEEKGLSQKLAMFMANNIYAWTIDFNRLQPGDRFKVIYTDKYIDDSTYVGVHNVKAAYFEHKGDSLYAFQFETDSINGTTDYFNEKAKAMRGAFLKSPLKFGRLSSRYNLKRRIAYYGYKVRPHKGTDFAAPVGTPILATANGTVTESTRRGGNGKYVKIRHNATYSTQYLHMSRQAVKKGEYVKQGDVIGYIGMTGNTGGPHVCYRFWKNGKQVDPFKEKLPENDSIAKELRPKFFKHITPVKQRLDNIFFLETEPEETEPTITQDLNLPNL